MDDPSRHRWIGTRILPLEVEARRWLARHVRSLTAADVDDLIQESYSRIWSADLRTIRKPRAASAMLPACSTSIRKCAATRICC